MAKLIEILFGFRTRVGQRNHVLDGANIPHGRGNFEGGEWRPIVKYRDTIICSKTAEPIEIPFGLWAQADPRNHVLDSPMQIPHGSG